MKKRILVPICSLLLFASCTSSDDVIDTLGLDCLTLVSDVIKAKKAHTDDASTANCMALLSAIQSYITNGCEEAEKYIKELESLSDCSIEVI